MSHPEVTQKPSSARGHAKLPSIPGTKVAAQKSQVLVSSGVPSLDALVGGGFPVGSIVLLEEDAHGVYSHVMVKYFLSQSIVLHHDLLFYSSVSTFKSIAATLPDVAEDTNTALQKQQGDTLQTDAASQDERMTIAWRYQQNTKVKSVIQPSQTITAGYSSNFDMSKTISKEAVSGTAIKEVSLNSGVNVYQELLSNISHYINKNGFSAKQPFTADEEKKPKVAKIVLQSFPSPFVIGESYLDSFIDRFPWFLYMLRSILRFSYAVCFITVPSICLSDQVMKRKVANLSDIVYGLESFAGSSKETNPTYKEYHGLCHLIKLPRLNCLTVNVPETLDLAFKLKRKRFVIEKLHLPPELSETVHREQDDLAFAVNKQGCASVGNKKLDF